ncbi:uncharacterized mitochondrial protein AtMg00810-like [Benincasa hispida]|uniref:uncharacterized mitochondrial protein AtMg00810-like n=1 Tax=Benincasa hispida TaxID=102211 RepID=UPI0018FFA0D8|nr:uncharacterized mitochondrial protein AtMg00810-like [Benincasa hispida]
MSLSLGYQTSQVPRKGEKLTCKLNKSTYRLKQASRQWFLKFTAALSSHGFHQSKSDYSLFTRGHGHDFVALLVYVDDILLTGPSPQIISSVKEVLKGHFKLKDLGYAKYFLGLELSRSQQGIMISQRKYCLQILEDTGFLEAKPVTTPMDPNLKLSKNEGEFLKADDITCYRRLICRLIYLQISQPDICFAIHRLSQFIHSPTKVQLNAAHHLLRYLKQSPGQGILISPITSFHLKAFVDVDWGSCPDTRRSITGFCIFLGAFIISWKSKKQATVSRSSAEAEYRALASVTSELMWISQLLKDLQVKILMPTTIFCDNQAVIVIASNPMFHERTKHIEIDYHFVQDKIAYGFLKVLPIQSSQQLADMFTKALLTSVLSKLVSKLGIIDIHHPT